MKAVQSKLFKDMKNAGINVTEHILTGKNIIFNGVVYAIKKVPIVR